MDISTSPTCSSVAVSSHPSTFSTQTIKNCRQFDIQNDQILYVGFKDMWGQLWLCCPCIYIVYYRSSSFRGKNILTCLKERKSEKE